jgi:O-antigen/teichoic acid export membrane protein
MTFLKEKTVEHLHFGKWLLGGDLMFWVQNQSVNYFCAGIFSISMVGAMNAARNVTGVVNILFLGLMNFLPPRAAGVFSQGGPAKLNSYLLRISFWGGLSTLIITLVASFGREFWLNLLYGHTYASYGWIVIWWSVYYFIGFFLRPVGVGLQVLNKTRSIFFSNLFGFILMLVIIYPLLLQWQVHGLMFVLCLNNLAVLVNLFARYRKFAQGAQRKSSDSPQSIRAIT